MSYQDDCQDVVRINEHELDKECIKLPSDYLRHAHHAANAKMDVDEAKAEMDVVAAEVGKDVRERPGKYGIEKITEASVQAAVITSNQFLDAQKAYFKAKRDAELSQAVVWALEHKKRSLTLLVDLHGTSYFASPKLSEEGSKVVQRMIQARVRGPGRRGED